MDTTHDIFLAAYYNLDESERRMIQNSIRNDSLQTTLKEVVHDPHLRRLFTRHSYVSKLFRGMLTWTISDIHASLEAILNRYCLCIMYDIHNMSHMLFFKSCKDVVDFLTSESELEELSPSSDGEEHPMTPSQVLEDLVDRMKWYDLRQNASESDNEFDGESWSPRRSLQCVSNGFDCLSPRVRDSEQPRRVEKLSTLLPRSSQERSEDDTQFTLDFATECKNRHKLALMQLRTFSIFRVTSEVVASLDISPSFWVECVTCDGDWHYTYLMEDF